MADTLAELNAAAEAEWLQSWTRGPSPADRSPLRSGDPAPDVELPDHTGEPRRLSSFWEVAPGLVMFWRHFGCGCGIQRAARLGEEHGDYLAAGLSPVIIGQGEPARARASKERYAIPCSILCDPDFEAYRAFGLGHFALEEVLYDAPETHWTHPKDLGEEFQAARREEGRPLVDDPWMAPGEFVVDTTGTIRLAYTYQYCEDFPDPRIHLAAAKLATR